jgi:hypothetical protein
MGFCVRLLDKLALFLPWVFPSPQTLVTRRFASVDFIPTGFAAEVFVDPAVFFVFGLPAPYTHTRRRRWFSFFPLARLDIRVGEQWLEVFHHRAAAATICQAHSFLVFYLCAIYIACEEAHYASWAWQVCLSE